MSDFWTLVVVFLVVGAVWAVGIYCWLYIGWNVLQAENARRNAEASIAAARERSAVQKFLMNCRLQRSQVPPAQSEGKLP